MEKHVQEELVIVESNAVGDPGAVVVHFEYAAIALRAVMTPIWLRLVAPLADAHATVALTFNGGSHSHYARLLRRRLAAGAGLLLRCLAVTATGVEWPSRRVKVLQILMDHFLRLSCLLLYQLVRELFTAACLAIGLLLCLSLLRLRPLLLLLEAALRGRRLHHGDSLFPTGRVRTHVPLFMLRDVPRICRNRPHNRNDEHRGGEGEEAGKRHGLLALLLRRRLVLVPGRLERDLAEVL